MNRSLPTVGLILGLLGAATQHGLDITLREKPAAAVLVLKAIK